MEHQDPAFQEIFAKEVCKMAKADRGTFFSKGTGKSSTDSITGGMSPLGYAGLFFCFFRWGCTMAPNVKPTNCLCPWGGRD